MVSGWWLACILGPTIALVLLWTNRNRALAWPEAMLIGLGLVISAGPMIKSFHIGPNGASVETKDIQAAADVAKGANDVAAQNTARIKKIEDGLVEINNSIAALRPVVTDPAARSKLDSATKVLTEQAIQAKPAQDATRAIQGEVDKVLQAHRKLFKF